MFENIDFTPGQITHNDFIINLNQPLDFDDDGLKEDMFKVNYPNNYILDIGWYSGVNKFIVFIIRDGDWEKPIKKIFCSNLLELNSTVEKCADYLRLVLSE
ncbi:hypothetical protein HOO54_10560 [Bacillus sp. WMMC1349]|uniref:hypothetical protein n=1 Tax=Bacillus sp. WMMC1349 TaxID=2736254 RepID=UPI00155249BC|nr:hypothetical protein [Bacillus sp. WMMC1349]NPC92658.1 hypothetical protein [Bacillus sp. WMMC1349]